MSTHTPIL